MKDLAILALRTINKQRAKTHLSSPRSKFLTLPEPELCPVAELRQLLSLPKCSFLSFQNNMFAKSGSSMNNSLNASLLAAAGIDARLLSQMSGGYGGSSGSSVAKARESPKPRPPEPETKETQAQRQAAAKLALRKQLEKTLLQVGGHISYTSYISYTRAVASIFY